MWSTLLQVPVLLLSRHILIYVQLNHEGGGGVVVVHNRCHHSSVEKLWDVTPPSAYTREKQIKLLTAGMNYPT